MERAAASFAKHYGSGSRHGNGLETFVVVHDQEVLQDHEREGRYRNLSRMRYVFVGGNDTNQLEARDDVIFARSLPDNLERYPNLLSFTAWYAIAHNRLATTKRVAILEYDVNVGEGFEARTIDALEAERCIAGYVPFRLTHPMYLHASPWLAASLQTIYGIDVEELIRDHLGSGGVDRWTCTTNAALRLDDVAAFVDWFLPLTAVFRDDPIGAHVHERTLPVFCILNRIDNVFIPDVLAHSQARSHGIYAVSQEEARERASKSLPLTSPDKP